MGEREMIYREDAIKAVKCKFNADLMDRIDAMLMTSAIAQITKNIANIPAVEVVRCCECKWWVGGEDYDCEIHSGAWTENDFCSYGERKESE